MSAKETRLEALIGRNYLKRNVVKPTANSKLDEKTAKKQHNCCRKHNKMYNKLEQRRNSSKNVNITSINLNKSIAFSKIMC